MVLSPKDIKYKSVIYKIRKTYEDAGWNVYYVDKNPTKWKDYNRPCKFSPTFTPK